MHTSVSACWRVKWVELHRVALPAAKGVRFLNVLGVYIFESLGGFKPDVSVRHLKLSIYQFYIANHMQKSRGNPVLTVLGGTPLAPLSRPLGWPSDRVVIFFDEFSP